MPAIALERKSQLANKSSDDTSEHRMGILEKESLSWLIKVVTTPRNIEWVFLRKKVSVG